MTGEPRDHYPRQFRFSPGLSPAEQEMLEKASHNGDELENWKRLALNEQSMRQAAEARVKELEAQLAAK